MVIDCRKPWIAEVAKRSPQLHSFGLHSFRRANITWWQEVGGSAIEVSKIAGHANVSMTGDYTIVQLQRQDDLARAIQDRMANAQKKQEEDATKQAVESIAAA